MDQKKPLEKVDGMANSTPYQNGSERHESLTPRGSISVRVTVINESTNYNIFEANDIIKSISRIIMVHLQYFRYFSSS